MRSNCIWKHPLQSGKESQQRRRKNWRRRRAKRVPVRGICNEQPFDDLRDMDDFCAPFWEVLTSTGKYYWIPLERVEFAEFRAPERPKDLLWRRCNMKVLDGPEGEVFIPALYAGTHQSADDQLRLGRGTDWVVVDNAPVRGIGQRMFLVGNQDLSIMQLEELTFEMTTPQ